MHIFTQDPYFVAVVSDYLLKLDNKTKKARVGRINVTNILMKSGKFDTIG